MARKKKEYKPTLLLDFDGVIHSYVSGWKCETEIPDPPVSHEWRKKGSNHSYSSIDWLVDLVKSNKFIVCIYSSRSKYRGGIKAMKAWLDKWGLQASVIDAIQFPKTKPATFLTVDDRAITFTGEFINADKLSKFKTWQGK